MIYCKCKKCEEFFIDMRPPAPVADGMSIEERIQVIQLNNRKYQKGETS